MGRRRHTNSDLFKCFSCWRLLLLCSFVGRPCEACDVLRFLRPRNCIYLRSLTSDLSSIRKEQLRVNNYIMVYNWGIRRLCPLYGNSYVNTDFIINCKLRGIFSEEEILLLKCDNALIPYVHKRIDKGQKSQYLFWILISRM